MLKKVRFGQVFVKNSASLVSLNETRRLSSKDLPGTYPTMTFFFAGCKPYHCLHRLPLADYPF